MHDFILAQQSAEQSIVATGMAVAHLCAEARSGAMNRARSSKAEIAARLVTEAVVAKR
jgi:hypothetical protein